MKCFLLAFLICFGLTAQPKRVVIIPRVDQRVELLNIIYHLARDSKFKDSLNLFYANRINTHFAAYVNHAAILYTKDLIKKYENKEVNLLEWEIPSLAVHLSPPPDLIPVVSKESSTTTDGWDNRTLLDENYITHIRDFYKNSNAARFFKDQEPYYQAVQQEYRRIGAVIDPHWIKEYFGLAPTETYFPIMSLSSNSAAYLRVNFDDAKRNSYTLFSCSAFSPAGIPDCFADKYFGWAMLHEYIHCFSNQLIDRDSVIFKEIGQRLLSIPYVNEQVKNTFYNNWRYLLYESLVRAVSIRYAIEHNELPQNIANDVQKQTELGFLWMKELVNELDNFDKRRKKSQTTEDFMPILIQLLKSYAIKR